MSGYQPFGFSAMVGEILDRPRTNREKRIETVTEKVILDEIVKYSKPRPDGWGHVKQLFDHQIEDIQRAFKRYESGGKGYLFTNGTGTGKTFVGLGIAKDFYIRDLKNIIIVVPTDKKANDWVEDGALLDLSVYKLNGINDKGEGIVVTTYANYYQNAKILERNFDLVIYDESHYLNQNAKGKGTSCLEKHRKIAKLPSHAKEEAEFLAGRKPQLDEADQYNFQIVEAYKKECKVWEAKRNEIAKEIVDSVKVLFLSATPFAYVTSIIYTDGTLFDINESIEEKKYEGGYNVATGFNKFLVDNFGYSMRYNKLTRPDIDIDVGLLERQFFDRCVEEGLMSTRILEVDKDYSRQFITVDSDIGLKINEGIEVFYTSEFREEFPKLHLLVWRKFNYNFMNQMLEVIKAREVIPRIHQHLNLGRKLVIFHGYNNSEINHPFRFDIEDMKLKSDEAYIEDRVKEEIIKYRKTYPKYWNLSLEGLKNTRDCIQDEFGDKCKQFNGKVSKARRMKYVNSFLEDFGETDIILVQIKAGKEGISLHDKTGLNQRTLMFLSLPTLPTDSIQCEGRIYRDGVRTNAIYEYITLQTNFERIAFAEKIAIRSRTAENLAMGHLARDLEYTFKFGYDDSSYIEPHLGQGYGSKEKDRVMKTSTPYEEAKTYYFMQEKKNSKNKSLEGEDYFATPEPLGFKMVEWLNPNPGNRMLEPSAGHGAIARWFPETTKNVMIEPSIDLSSKLAIYSKGDIIRNEFESYWYGNKFELIAMNPPFGNSGKKAMEHLSKACSQLTRGGVLLAIIPDGPSMQKRLDMFMQDPKNREYLLTGEILLPPCTFKRAGTTVRCKIIRIEVEKGYGFRQRNGEVKKGVSNYNRINLSEIESIETLFDVLEDLKFD